MSTRNFDTEIQDFISRLNLIPTVVNNVKQRGQYKYTESMLRNKYTLISRRWENTLEEYAALKNRVPQSEHKDYEIFEPEYMRRAEERFREARNYLSSRLADIVKVEIDASGEITSDKVASDEANPDAAPIFLNSGSPELPEVCLPKFAGDPANWMYFENLFTSCVIKNAKLCDAERLLYLNSCLEGKALAMFEPFGIADFGLAWDILKRYFGSPRIVITRLLDSIVDLKPIKRDDLESLEQVTVGWRQTLAALKKLDCPVEHWSDLLVFLVKDKLEAAMDMEWELSLKSSKEYPSFGQMLEFLDMYAMALLCPNQERRKLMADSQAKSLRRRDTVVEGSPVVTKCVFRRQSHEILQCSEFRRLTPEQRLCILKSRLHCIVCLDPGHAASSCQSALLCRKCSGRHNTLLRFSSPEKEAGGRKQPKKSSRAKRDL